MTGSKSIVPKTVSDSRQRLAWTLMAIVAIVGLVGCSSMGSIEPLEVTLSNIKVPEVTLFETTLIATLRITNPNPEGFTIDGASFKLFLDEKKVGTGTTSETFTVDRLDSAVVEAVFHINNASALLRLKDIFQEKEVSYGIRGSLFTQGSFGTKKIKVEKMGRIDLTEMQAPKTDEPDLLKLQPGVNPGSPSSI